jgi:hypothetical protein
MSLIVRANHGVIAACYRSRMHQDAAVFPR